MINQARFGVILAKISHQRWARAQRALRKIFIFSGLNLVVM